KAVIDGLKRLGNLVPKSPSEMGKLRMKLVTAGYRGTEALIVFFGIRVALAVAAFAMFATPIIFNRPNFIMALGACGIGYLLVTMLVQTDKFGTSVAQSLRVHSDVMRTKRRQRAEEAAAKTGVKMVFPLVFCIFPAIWVVTIGPAAIKFVQVLFPMAQN